jgi:hypothetical protein
MGTLGYKPKDKNITKLKKYINGLGNDNKQHRTRNEEYKFVTIVGDGNDMYKRITDDSGSMEANACLVNTFNNTI